MKASKQYRIFKIAHRSAKHFRNNFATYTEAFAHYLTQEYKRDEEAIADGTIEDRIFIQYLLIEGDTKEAQKRSASNMTFLEALQESFKTEKMIKGLVAIELNNTLTISINSEISIAA